MARKESALEKRAREIGTNEAEESRTGTEVSGFDRKLLLPVVGGGVLLVALISWFMLRDAGTSDTELAAMELGRLEQAISEQDFAAQIAGDPSTIIDGTPIRGLPGIVDEYGDTKAGRAAALQLGEAYLVTGDPAKATEAYETAAAADDNLVRAAALAGLASVAESEGNFEAAAGRYDEAIALYDREQMQADLIRPLYLLAAARNYEAAGKKDEAIERYRSVATLYPASQQNSAARFALARYGEEI